MHINRQQKQQHTQQTTTTTATSSNDHRDNEKHVKYFIKQHESMQRFLFPYLFHIFSTQNEEK